MSKDQNTAIQPTRAQDYPEWYQQVIKAAELAETSVVRGCMVIKPWGYAIWEKMQKDLDRRFKETGHVNAYFPLFIPMSYLEKEAKHVEGFAKECAVVTHHRLEADGKGGLKPGGPLDEPLVVRPTSEMIIGETYAKWVQSYRDLPILINQWANVVRWEMRTRMFLRTTEFLWQEGHTVHATADEAIEETLKMLDVYEDFAHSVMAMPVIKGEKTADERFPGAVNTYTIEAMMQDFKALQAGTSHFLGQNFSQAQEIKFSDQDGQQHFAWTTSWGVSTRLIGGLIMTHSDDDGLVLPPKLAPKHVVILPIYRKEEDRQQVIEYCHMLQKQIQELSFEGQAIEVELDQRDLRGGEKAWQWIKKGAPIRVEVGPRDVKSDAVFFAQRHLDHKDKRSLDRQEFIKQLPTMLSDMQRHLFDKAKARLDQHTQVICSIEDLEDYFKGEESNNCGFALCHWSEEAQEEDLMKKLKISPRCIPLGKETTSGPCLATGKPTTRQVIFAKSY